ncbi:hypothetical protein HQ489_02485 [Candidatus Woesearchaeota archaeon]|nr:hypothetical protein [Candidatus Woesearchaeota archaeon]
MKKKRRFSEEDALDFIKISIGINRIDQVLNIYRKTDGTAQFFGDCMKIENFLEEDKEKLFQEIYQNEKSNVTLVKTASNFGLYNLASQYIDTLNHEELEQIGIYDFETIAKNVDRRDLKERLIGLYENKNEYESAAEVALELGLLKRAKRNAQMYINSSENGNAPMNKVRIAYKVGLGNRADILNEEIKNLERKGNFEVCLNLAKIAGDQERIALYGLIIED